MAQKGKALPRAVADQWILAPRGNGFVPLYDEIE
jgi:hypothetical protein